MKKVRDKSRVQIFIKKKKNLFLNYKNCQNQNQTVTSSSCCGLNKMCNVNTLNRQPSTQIFGRRGPTRGKWVTAGIQEIMRHFHTDLNVVGIEFCIFCNEYLPFENSWQTTVKLNDYMCGRVCTCTSTFNLNRLHYLSLPLFLFLFLMHMLVPVMTGDRQKLAGVFVSS